MLNILSTYTNKYISNQIKSLVLHFANRRRLSKNHIHILAYHFAKLSRVSSDVGCLINTLGDSYFLQKLTQKIISNKYLKLI